MEFYLEPWKKFADFSGRSRRKEYWTFSLINSVILYALSFMITAINSSSSSSFSLFSLLVLLIDLVVIVPSLAVLARRLHDVGRSGWYMLISLIPLVGGIMVLIATVSDSQPGTNQYGPNPKAVMAVPVV